MNNEPLQQSNETPMGNQEKPSEVVPGGQQPMPPALELGVPRVPSPQGKRGSKKIAILMAILVLLVAGASAWFINYRSDAADQKAAAKVYRVGILDGLEVFFGESVTGFKQKMTELGYIEGKNIIYDVQNRELTGNQAVIEKFVQDKVDLVVTIPTEPSLEAKEVLKGTNIPIISMNASVEGTGLVDSVERPGHNIAGVRYPGPEDSVKRLQILHQLIPTATRVLVPHLKDYPNVPAQIMAMQASAKTLGLTLIVVPLAPPDIAAYVAGLSATDPGFDAIVGAAEPFVALPSLNAPLYAYAAQHKIPILAGSVSTDSTGPIASVISANLEVGASGASLADKIFKGAQAGTLPMVTPTSYLEVNLKVAQVLGITPDTGLLSTATKIVK